MVTNIRKRQSGAFILVTVVFLMVVGSIFIYSMTNLSTVASSTSGIVHNGNAALAAAQSGLKYCLYTLDKTGCVGALGSCLPYPESSGVSPSPCSLTITHNCTGASLCWIKSTAICASSSPSEAKKVLKMDVEVSGGGCQVIPPSLRYSD